jgi:hypothetical protein
MHGECEKTKLVAETEGLRSFRRSQFLGVLLVEFPLIMTEDTSVLFDKNAMGRAR